MEDSRNRDGTSDCRVDQELHSVLVDSDANGTKKSFSG
jgi:hypothetical protein